MPGFLHHFATGLRISFGAKQVWAKVESLTPAQGARLTLMASLFRLKMLHDTVPGSHATINEVVQRPNAYRPEICYTAYQQLHAIREESREKIRSYASFKILPSPEFKNHIEICDLALSLLMCTIAVGYTPSTLDAVRNAWERVATFSPLPSDVALVMNMPEDVVAELITTPLDPEEWLELARQSPDFLHKVEPSL